MEYLAAAAIGVLAGIAAKMLSPGRDPGGFIVSAVLGVIGAELATVLAAAAGWSADDSALTVGAAVGAAALVLAIRLATFRRRGVTEGHPARPTSPRSLPPPPTLPMG